MPDRRADPAAPQPRTPVYSVFLLGLHLVAIAEQQKVHAMVRQGRNREHKRPDLSCVSTERLRSPKPGAMQHCFPIKRQTRRASPSRSLRPKFVDRKGLCALCGWLLHSSLNPLLSGYDVPKQSNYGNPATEPFVNGRLSLLKQTKKFRRMDFHWCLTIERQKLLPSSASRSSRPWTRHACSRGCSSRHHSLVSLLGHSIGMKLLGKDRAFQFFS